MTDAVPNLETVAMAAFLHDVGKLYQRSIGAVTALPPDLQAAKDTYLPRFGGRHGFLHVLFSLHFLDQTAGLPLPAGIDREALRELVGHHHSPGWAPEVLRRAAWTIATADRLSAGMDRKALDRELDLRTGWERFRRLPQAWLLDRIDIGQGEPPARYFSVPAALDAAALRPFRATGDPASPAVTEGYRELAETFRNHFAELCRVHGSELQLFHEGLIALSHDLLWSVPSSTRDQPDVPLHDHALAAAAFASCLHSHHAAFADLDDRRRVVSRGQPKFHLVQGELVGIQRTLFRLKSEQVKGVNRILRARSFLMQMIVDAAILRIQQAFDLPPYVVLMRAGGKFLILLPVLPDDQVQSRIEALRAEFDAWLADTYQGDLALVLGLTQPLPGAAFAKKRVIASLDEARRAARSERQRVLATRMAQPILEVDFPEDPDGTCAACGVRPAIVADKEDKIRRCIACDAEHHVGRLLPHDPTVLWVAEEAFGRKRRGWSPFRLRLRVFRKEPPSGFRQQAVSAFRLPGTAGDWPFAKKFLNNHLPRLGSGLANDSRFVGLSEEAIHVATPGQLLTMEHLGALARDRETGLGIPALAVLKADVDRLGHAFAIGLGADATPGRLVTLSRLIDAFYTIRLPDPLGRDYPDTYTVFAGGDDLLLIGPWPSMVCLGRDLRGMFRAYVGGNHNLTLSAGLELVNVKEPLNRSLRRAEARLAAAKATAPGEPRDRVSLIDPEPFAPMGWETDQGLRWLMRRTRALEAMIIRGQVSTGWLQMLLRLLDQRAKAEREPGESGGPINDAERAQAAIWRAHYVYHLERRFEKAPDHKRFFNELMALDGKDAPTRSAISAALWRQRGVRLKGGGDGGTAQEMAGRQGWPEGFGQAEQQEPSSPEG